MRIVASVFCCQLTRVAPGVVFCYCSPSASRFDCCAFRDALLLTLVVMSGYLSYCCLSISSNQSGPFSSDLGYQQGIFAHSMSDTHVWRHKEERQSLSKNKDTYTYWSLRLFWKALADICCSLQNVMVLGKVWKNTHTIHNTHTTHTR